MTKKFEHKKAVSHGYSMLVARAVDLSYCICPETSQLFAPFKGRRAFSRFKNIQG